jgi:hypothetical protein
MGPKNTQSWKSILISSFEVFIKILKTAPDPTFD